MPNDDDLLADIDDETLLRFVSTDDEAFFQRVQADPRLGELVHRRLAVLIARAHVLGAAEKVLQRTRPDLYREIVEAIDADEKKRGS